jgi:diadenosine tetraphosphatase ApaH/serine/threonine PP2A family protein phosphatase
MKKLALLSDIHANLEAMTAVLADVRQAGADAIVCLGDLVGYGADPAACVDLLRSLEVTAMIQGNHDAYAADDRDLESFNPLAQAATLWTRRQLDAERRAWLAGLPLRADIAPDIELVHATPSEPQSWSYVRFAGEGALAMLDQSARLCFYGHTHVPMAFRQREGAIEQFIDESYDLAAGDRWLVNVGSVGQPRDGDWRAAWVLFDLAAQRLTLRRVAYDVKACQAKILAAGLPARLAERLSLGR